MNIIFIHKKWAKPLHIDLHGRRVWGVLAALVLLPVLVGVGVSRLTARPAPVAANGGHQRELQAQVQLMSQHLAEMQAHMARLDALGQHLVESNNIQSREFDFHKRPPMGGPASPSLSLSGEALLQTRLQALSAAMDYRDAELEALDSVLRQRRQDDPSLLLTSMPVRHGIETSPFGYRSDPFNGRVSFHPGIDFATAEGSGVYATASGVVTWAGERNGYGNLVEINHGDGVLTHYGHCRDINVHLGEVVSRGQLIAHVGSTGRSTGPHLHYEVVRNGEPVDPANFIASALVRR